MQEKQLHWYDTFSLLPLLIIFIPSLFAVLKDPYGRITLNFLLFTMNFQSLTIVLTSLLFAAIYCLLIHKVKFMDRVILTIVTTVLATHFYEAFHALFQLYVTGTTGITLWILNIPVVIWLGLFIFFYGRKHKVLHVNLWVVFLFIFFIPCFDGLRKTGFFLNPDMKGFEWALTKVIGYAMWIPLFIEDRKRK